LFLICLVLGVSPSVAEAQAGLVMPPDAGPRLIYCERPVSLTLKVDSSLAPATRLLAGTAELRDDEGVGRHRDNDEILYVIRGWGRAVFGSDTLPLGPGSLLYVPPGVSHRIISTGAAPMEYFFVLSPNASSAGFRRAAEMGCPGLSSPAPVPAAAAQPTPVVTERRAVVLDPGAGDRISYCPFPLVITMKVDSVAVPGARLTAAAGALRRGSEEGTHPDRDEVVYITRGGGRAFIGNDTARVEAGWVTYVPRGTRHGFINDDISTFEYVIVYAGGASQDGFRRLATRPGPYCPPAP
jgi:mannose-6-phosphate isomerase-like protein (cupin superfamily)